MIVVRLAFVIVLALLNLTLWRVPQMIAEEVVLTSLADFIREKLGVRVPDLANFLSIALYFYTSFSRVSDSDPLSRLLDTKTWASRINHRAGSQYFAKDSR